MPEWDGSKDNSKEYLKKKKKNEFLDLNGESQYFPPISTKNIEA